MCVRGAEGGGVNSSGGGGGGASLLKYSQLRFLKPVIFQSQSHFSNNYSAAA